MGFIVGSGVSVRFWFDDWVGVESLGSLFPRLFRVVSNKQSSVHECNSCEGDRIVWRIPLRRTLRQLEEFEYESLLSLLSNIFLCRDVNDTRIWKPSGLGLFSVKSFTVAMEPSSSMRHS